MINFKPLGEKVNIIADFMQKSPIEFCDISIGAKYMWRDEFRIDYAIFDNTLILKETAKDYKNAFYYPIGDNVEGALVEIENYCRAQNIPLLFCCIDNDYAVKLTERYPFSKVYNDRDWSDYIYEAESFKNFSGKKFSGQRNHVNKFKKTYPDYEFLEIKEEDLGDIDEFLLEYERNIEYSLWSQKEEEEKVRDYIKKSFRLSQKGAMIKVDGKVVAISLGEVVKNTLIVHVEKGLKSYAGVYPLMASEFAKAYATGEVKYINREEECGDMGLRISKLQYHPIEVKQKNFVKVGTAFSKIKPPILIETPRLLLAEIEERDSEKYKEIYINDKLNEFWGYDYKEDLVGEPTKEYFYQFMKGLKKKEEEYSLAVKKDGVMIGELVMHGFDYYGNVEIGFRIEEKHQRKGYAFESVKALIGYIERQIKPRKIKAKCYKLNGASKGLIKKLGFKEIGENREYFFFELN